MKRLMIVSVLIAVGCVTSNDAPAGCPPPQTLPSRIAIHRSQFLPWHGSYYHTAWGSPVALVVPPTAGAQTNWHWGVGGTRINPIRHQFARPYPFYGELPGPGFQPTPYWPSDTDQFGVYYIRGPW